MMQTRRANLKLGMGVLAVSCLPSVSWAQAGGFPDHPVKIVVGFPPGQSGDTVVRLVAQKMGPVLGQSVIVENKPGAGAIIGIKAVKDAKPDGYTLSYISVASLLINPALGAALPYDTAKDFVQIGTVNSAALILVVKNSLPVKTLPELVAYSKQQATSPNFGSAGIGFANHLTMEMLMQRSGMKMVHIPYTGDAAAVTGLLAGDLDAMFLTTTVALPLIKADKVKAIAIASRAREAIAPEIPTVIESGFEVDVENWGSLMAPAGTPAPVIERLNAALQVALDDADVKKTWASMGIKPMKASVAETNSFVAKKRAEWVATAKATGIRLP